MKDLISKVAADIIQNPKTTGAVAVITSVNGWATAKEWIELNIGVISSCIGAVATIIMVAIQIRKSWREEEEYQFRKKNRELEDDIE